MHYFQYYDNELWCESVPIKKIVESVGTPVYVYSLKTIRRHIKVFYDAFEGLNFLLCYAVKANSNISVLKAIGDMGCGADVVSGGELMRSLLAGIPPEKIVYAGVGKTDEEIRMALTKGILGFNVESEEELHVVNAIAKELRRKAPVSLRVNPGIDPLTHPYIATGLRNSKFGISIEDALDKYKLAIKYPWLKVVGIHTHIGSQITQTEPFFQSIREILQLVEELSNLGVELEYIDLGGGLGIKYQDETPPHPSQLAEVIVPPLSNVDLQVIFEPGRAIVGNAGILVTRVIYTKAGGEKHFVIVDAAMNDLIRPSLYNAYHEIQLIDNSDSANRRVYVVDVVGPICESGDFLAKDRVMREVVRGELLAVMSAGAYGFSMASNYNSRPRVAEVLVNGNDFRVVRERETFDDMIKLEM